MGWMLPLRIERVRVALPPPHEAEHFDQAVQLLSRQPCVALVGARVGAWVGALVWKGRQSASSVLLYTLYTQKALGGAPGVNL